MNVISGGVRRLLQNSYITSALFGAGTRGVSLGAQILALLVMAWLLPKAEFGDMMTAFAVYRILSYGIGTGCAAIIVYHVSRQSDDSTEIRTHRSLALIGFIVGGLMIGTLVLAAPAIGIAVGKPRIAYWLIHLAPFGLLSTLVTLAGGAYDGRHAINRSIFLVELLPNIVRVFLLGLLFIFGGPAVLIAYALALAHLVAWLAVLRRLLTSTVSGFYRVTRWDMWFTARYILHSLLSLQLQGIDMVVVGWLFTSNVAADYAIAGRIAALFPFFQQIVLKKFAPRCGYLLAAHDYTALEHEAGVCRSSSVAAVASLTGFLLMIAPLLLRGAGDFASAITMMVALGAAPYVRSFFAGGETILRMGGQSGFNLGIMAASFALVVATPLLLHHFLGIFSLPLGMVFSALLLNPLIVFRVRRLFGIRLLLPQDWSVLLSGLVIFAWASRYATQDLSRVLTIGIAIIILGVLGMLLHIRPVSPFRLSRPHT
uniref:lipopolysaccharide biosynthesis protein n=1 Tax=Sphingomonas populi TaxID=2484750 RepID=UPI0013EE5E9F|nr:oligosaccharide flippase family protein [Sphingomonas populi]